MERYHDLVVRRNKEQSPFLRLASELRNKICELVSKDTNIFIYVADAASGRLGFRFHDRNAPYEDPFALWKVCRQLNSETVHLAWASITWVGTLPCLLGFLCSAQPARLASVSSIRIQISRVLGHDPMDISSQGMICGDNTMSTAAKIFAKMGDLKHVKVEWPATLNSGAAHELFKAFIQQELRLPQRVLLEAPASAEVLEFCTQT